jgi:hypothetical protein
MSSLLNFQRTCSAGLDDFAKKWQVYMGICFMLALVERGAWGLGPASLYPPLLETKRWPYG